MDLAGLEAARTDVETLRRPVHERTNALHVRVPPPVRPAVGVGDPLAEERLFPADVAHGYHGSPSVAERAAASAPISSGGSSRCRPGASVRRAARGSSPRGVRS